MNRFSIVLPIRCEPDKRMIDWWNAMLASEYSSMCSPGAELRNSSNIRRSPAISSSEAFSVASRAAMLSIAAHISIISTICFFVLQDAHDVVSPSRPRLSGVDCASCRLDLDSWVIGGVAYLIYQKPPPGYEASRQSKSDRR